MVSTRIELRFRQAALAGLAFARFAASAVRVDLYAMRTLKFAHHPSRRIVAIVANYGKSIILQGVI